MFVGRDLKTGLRIFEIVIVLGLCLIMRLVWQVAWWVPPVLVVGRATRWVAYCSENRGFRGHERQ
jgi:hypothetical protein